MARRKQFYMNRKPRTPKCAESNKSVKVPVPLTPEGVERLGGLSLATKNISRLLGYPIEVKVVDSKGSR